MTYFGLHLYTCEFLCVVPARTRVYIIPIYTFKILLVVFLSIHKPMIDCSRCTRAASSSLVRNIKKTTDQRLESLISKKF